MNRKKDGNKTPAPRYTGRAYAYISAALTAASLVCFALIFTAEGIYALIASVLLSLAALCFANVQKRKNGFKGLIYITVCAYCALGISAAVFAGGIIWAAVK